MEFKSKVTHKVLSGQTREVIANVIHFMRREARENEPVIDFKQVQKRVAVATGVSISSIRRISQQMQLVEDGESSSFETPNEKRAKSASKTNLDDFDKGLLRRLIINYYVTEKSVPTIKSIHQKFSQENGYTGTAESLRKVVKSIGFRWRKAQNNRKILMEKPDIQQLRRNFLRNMLRYRREKRPIIYMDETYIHSSHTQAKSWNDNSNEGLHVPISKGQRLIIVHAGGEEGFVANAYLKFKSNTKSGDYHSEMNYSNYKKWLQEMLIPNLPKNSVLVVDNAPYHNVQLDKAPNMTTKKDDMKEWLTRRNIPFTDDMTKVDLYSIIKSNKPRCKTYEIDSIMAQYGHSVLRLPPYHPDLNPIELVWASLKQYVAQRNVQFNFKTVERLCDEFFASFSTEEWKKRCEHAKGFEQFFADKEPALELVLENIIINLRDGSETEDSSDEISSDSDSELSEIE